MRITIEAFSETPLARNESQTTCMPLTLTCCVGGASSEGWLAASVAEGNMGGGQADPPTSAEDGETRSEWSKLGQLHRLITPCD